MIQSIHKTVSKNMNINIVEIADVLFVARSLAELRDIDIGKELNTVIEENIQKDESTDGEKVTKEGLKL